MLATHADAVERLGGSFEFRPGTNPEQPGWFTVDGIKTVQPIGEDGSGGVFALLSPSLRVLYVSSEGQAGIIAASFDEFIQLLMACPYWQDILNYSANGQLAEMRRAALALEATSDVDDDVEEARAFLINELGLTAPDDPVGALHRALSTADIVARASYGEPFTTLFGRFTIDDNPFFRDTVE
jgi:hypothetical protein